MGSKIPYIIVGFLVCCFFGWVAWVNLAPYGVIYEKDFTQPGTHAFVSDFTPGDRVQKFTTLVKDPVYMHVRAPRSFATAQLTLFGSLLDPMRVAVQTGPTRDEFALYTVDAPTGERGEVTIPLHGAYRDSEGRYTFIFAFADQETNPEIIHATVQLYD